MLNRIFSFLNRARPKPVSEWFSVTFDETAVRMHVEPPGKEPWDQEFHWDAIIRICFKSEDLWVSDGIYVFTRDRPESYVIPTEATGGLELWSEILRRNLYDPQLAIDVATSTGDLRCWPPLP